MEIQKVKTLAKDKLEFVSSIITDKEGNVLVFKRRQNLKLDPGKYDFCSGHIKEGEVPIQAMYRELNEELGITPEQIKRLNFIGSIDTPHKKFLQTLTYVYDIQLNLDKEIDEMINKVHEPEMEDVYHIDSIETLKKMIEESEKFRMITTNELEIALKEMERRINKRKEERKEECEER